MKTSQGGWTLLELLLGLALAAWLLQLGLSAWSSHLRTLSLAEARQALLHDARFLEAWRVTHPHAARAAKWPPLPQAETRDFIILFGSRREHTPGRYRLIAEPKQGRELPGSVYLRMDQNGDIVECRLVAGREWC